MAKYVFILGAGASADSGAPMMREFLDVAEDLMRVPNASIDRASFDLVFEGIHHLRRVHSNARLEIDNVENVFAAFEMAALFGRLGDMPPARVQELPDAIRALIVDTIESSFKFELGAMRILPLKTYRRFASLIHAIRENGDSVAIITFNYDLGVDVALSAAGIPFHYGFGDADDGASSVALLKLHGSLNWSKPDRDANIRVTTIPDLEASTRWHSPAVTEAVPFSRLQSDDAVPLVGAPFIVPPTWSKMQEYRSIAPCWRTAASELRTAETIVVSGFSLQPSDAFFRLLFALGTTGSTRIRSIRVVDPSKAVRDRFEELLGQSTVGRFHWQSEALGHALVRDLFDIAGVMPPFD